MTDWADKKAEAVVQQWARREGYDELFGHDLYGPVAAALRAERARADR